MNKSTLNYRIGDLFTGLKEEKEEFKYICHIVNNIGVMGAGFVNPLRKKYPFVEEEYKKNTPVLGGTQFLCPEYQVIVANMCAQRGILKPDNWKPIKYLALCKCMEQVREHVYREASRGIIASDFSNANDISSLDLNKIESNLKDYIIVAPLFGSDLAGGCWDFIEELIQEIWVDNGIKTVIYQLPGKELRSVK